MKTLLTLPFFLLFLISSPSWGADYIWNNSYGLYERDGVWFKFYGYPFTGEVKSESTSGWMVEGRDMVCGPNIGKTVKSNLQENI